MLGENGLFAIFQDPSKLDALPENIQKGLGALIHYMTAGDFLYSGTPLRVNGRAIGTFCCLYTGLKDGLLPESNKALQVEKAAAAARIVDEVADTSGVGSPCKR